MTNQVRMFIIVTLLFILQLFSPPLVAEVNGQIIAYNCYSCHGEKLVDLGSRLPSSSIELAETLLAFKQNQQKATVMDRITKGYTDAELKAVAVFINEQLK